MKLLARPQDDLNWKIESNPKFFEFDLGLHEPNFSLDDELYFQSLCVALTHFTENVWPEHESAKVILYRGSADFSTHFQWTEQQVHNFNEWEKQFANLSKMHKKRLFCAMSFVHYFQMLSHRLPDEMTVHLHLHTKGCGTKAETLHLLATERFEHFTVETDLHFCSNVGVCFPSDAMCNQEILQKIDQLLDTLVSYRPVYETTLTEEWDGLDEIIVFSDVISSQGRRKLLGFEAAGGKIIEI